MPRLYENVRMLYVYLSTDVILGKYLICVPIFLITDIIIWFKKGGPHWYDTFLGKSLLSKIGFDIIDRHWMSV